MEHETVWSLSIGSVTASCTLIREFNYLYDGDDESVKKEFDACILPMIQETYEQDGIPDYPARCEAFNNWTDALCKDGEISDRIYNEIDHPRSCER